MNNMSIESIAQEISEFISANLVQNKDVELAPDNDLIGGELLDSTAMVELILWLETRYTIQVDPMDLNPETLGTTRRIAEYVKKASRSDK